MNISIVVSKINQRKKQKNRSKYTEAKNRALNRSKDDLKGIKENIRRKSKGTSVEISEEHQKINPKNTSKEILEQIQNNRSRQKLIN